MEGWVRNLDLHSDLGSACRSQGNKGPRWGRRPCSRLGDREGAAPGTQEWALPAGPEGDAEPGCGRATLRMRHKAPTPHLQTCSQRSWALLSWLCSQEQEGGGDQPRCGERASGVSADAWQDRSRGKRILSRPGCTSRGLDETLCCPRTVWRVWGGR